MQLGDESFAVLVEDGGQAAGEDVQRGHLGGEIADPLVGGRIL